MKYKTLYHSYPHHNHLYEAAVILQDKGYEVYAETKKSNKTGEFSIDRLTVIHPERGYLSLTVNNNPLFYSGLNYHFLKKRNENKRYVQGWEETSVTLEPLTLCSVSSKDKQDHSTFWILSHEDLKFPQDESEAGEYLARLFERYLLMPASEIPNNGHCFSFCPSISEKETEQGYLDSTIAHKVLFKRGEEI